MAQLYFSLACVLATLVFWFGEGHGVGTQLEGNRGSFVCQQNCYDLDGEGVREIRDDTLFVGNYTGSCVCQQSCSGQAEAKLEQSNTHLQNFTDLMGARLQEVEIKMAATTNKVESLQQTVDQLTQRTITEDRMEAMLQRMVSSIEIKMAATTNKVESLQQTVDQRTITEDRMEAMLQRMVSTIEIRMAATTNTVDGLQQTVSQPTVTQQTVSQPTVTQQTTQNVRSGCPIDFVFNLRANICFKLYMGRLSRVAASTACQNLQPSARLAVLDTSEKVQLVAEHLSARFGNLYVWIGGLQEDNEGRWLWETGQEVTGPWGRRQPDNAGGNEDCLMIYRSSSSSTCLLHDAPCSYRTHYICTY